MDAQESQIYTAIIIAIFVIGAVIGYFIYSAIQHQRKVLTMERRNAHAEITALEKDRARIAADLHDDLAPVLSAIRMRINSFDLAQPDDQQQLQKTNQNIDEMAARMRAISFDLMPASLLRKGLTEGLRELVSFFSGKDKLKMKLILPEQAIHVQEQQAIHLYRIVQEIIHNTIKHAKASELLILLEQDDKNLYLTTKDNGIGFDYGEKQKQGAGLGLSSLENRTTLLKGERTLTSKPGQGATYRFRIPLN